MSSKNNAIRGLKLSLVALIILHNSVSLAGQNSTPRRIVGPQSQGMSGLSIVSFVASRSHLQPELRAEHIGQFPLNRYDLNDPSQARALESELSTWIQIAHLQERASEARKANQALESVLSAEEMRWLGNPELEIDEDVLVALQLMSEMMKSLNNNSLSGDERQRIIWNLATLADSVSNNYRYPVPRYSLHDALFADRRIGTQPRRGSLNLSAESFRRQRYSQVSAQNLTFGFGRTQPLVNGSEVFEYSKKKSGYGAHAGFRVKLGSRKFKIRLGSEIRTGPVNTRILDLMGYNVPQIHYLPNMKLKYERKLFTEFNSRKHLNLRLTMGQSELLSVPIQSYIHPFQFIVSAKLKNGQEILVNEFEQRLLGRVYSLREVKDWTNESLANLIEQNGKDFEKNVAEIKFGPVSIEEKVDDILEVGPWDFNQGQKEHLREMRAFAYVAAWLGLFDVRFENTRLSLTKTSEGYVMKHVLSDVGSGWGITTLPYINDRIEDFPDTFKIYESLLMFTSRVVSENFVPNEYNIAFSRMSVDDAKYAARLIQQVSPEQIRQALAVSGFSGTELETAMRKILLRKADAEDILSPGYR